MDSGFFSLVGLISVFWFLVFADTFRFGLMLFVSFLQDDKKLLETVWTSTGFNSITCSKNITPDLFSSCRFLNLIESSSGCCWNSWFFNFRFSSTDTDSRYSLMFRSYGPKWNSTFVSVFVPGGRTIYQLEISSYNDDLRLGTFSVCGWNFLGTLHPTRVASSLPTRLW